MRGRMTLCLVLALCSAECRGGEVRSPEPPPTIKIPWADAGTDPVAVPDVPAEPADDMTRTAAPLEGPEKTLSLLCDKCSVARKVPAQAPYRAVQVVTSTWKSPAPGKMMNTSYSLAIRTDEGWYLLGNLGTSGMLCGGESLFHVDFDLEGLEIRDVVPGEPPEILVAWQGSAHDIRDSEILVCSIGPSGTPSCVGPLVSVRDHPSAAQSWDSNVTFTPAGELTFTSDAGTTGPFTLVFP